MERDRMPYVGVGCIVMHDGRMLLVRNQRDRWSTPGGLLEYGESPASAAARETLEETGVTVGDVEFVAVTNDVIEDVGRHYSVVPQAPRVVAAPCGVLDYARWRS